MSESNETETVTEETTVEAEAPVAAAPALAVKLNGGKVITTIADFSASKEWPRFSEGDTVRVHYKIKEGDKERIQIYEGNVISMRGEGQSRTFIVRRVSHEVGVERIFPYHSPSIANLEVIRRGKVRRSKLFYLRHKSGKEGRIKEQFDNTIATAQGSKKKTKNTRKRKREEAQKAKGEYVAPVAATPAPSEETTES